MGAIDAVALLRRVAQRLEDEGRALRGDLSVSEEVYIERERRAGALEYVAWAIRRAVEDAQRADAAGAVP
jgi:hypothetical protein